MREISSREYALNVSDVVSDSIEDALMGAFELITRKMGCIADYDERQVKSAEMIAAFQMGIGATWRDQAIELFEHYGLDVKPDGKEW